MSGSKLLIALLMASTVLGGCIERTPIGAPVQVQEIAWFKGSLEQAVVSAQQQNKPLLIYWGAVWCPYCQALKKTVFTRADFIEKSKLFIPVYLDGDLPGAQAWGQKLKVNGYPTVLVLRADQTEIARLTGGMDLSSYALLIDDAIRDERPIQTVLASAHLSTEDCHRLSFYAWDPEALVGTDIAHLTSALTGTAKNCLGTDQVRLEVLALNFALQGHASPADLQDRVQLLFERLGQTDTVRGALDLLTLADDSLYTVVTSMGWEFTTEFRTRYVARMQEAADSASLAQADRLLALASALDAAKALSADKMPPAAMQASARARVEAALTSDQERFTRGDIVNAAGIVYDVLGDDEAAYQMYLRELPNTKTPYYYMSHLGAIAEKRGQTQPALTWFAKAYSVSEGPATRVRWGGSYVRALIRLTPEDAAGIRAAALGVAADLGPVDRAQGRTRDSFSKVRMALEQWATTPERKVVLTDVMAHLPA